MPRPTSIKLHRTRRTLEVAFDNGDHFDLPFEYLRVYSPSAEVRGHGADEPNLIPGKRDVTVDKVVPVGRYAVRLVFSDGHDTGLYSWDVLHELGTRYAEWWQIYLDRMDAAGMARDSDVVKLSALPKKYTPK